MSYRYPFTPYPYSWYRIAYSHEIATGEIRRVSYLGEELIVYRGEDGCAHVLDAHCPHLGADFSAGGHVHGDRICCPFHGWQFAADGRCTNIPYCTRIPVKARVRSWPVREMSGAIFFYYHPDGGAPAFELPADGPFDSDCRWNAPVLNEWIIRMHIQEVAENAVDSAHFPKVHAYAEPPSIQSLVTDGPRFTVKLLSRRYGLNFVGASPMTITYHGFGVVHAHLTTRLFGRWSVEVAVLLTATPVDQEHVEIRILARKKRSRYPFWDALMRPMMKREIRADFAKDIPIWEHKRYRTRPVLCQDDGPISTIRSWAAQFYPTGEAADQTGSQHAA